MEKSNENSSEVPYNLAADMKTLGEWQKSIHHELKSINGKLNFFVILAILVLAIYLLMALLSL